MLDHEQFAIGLSRSTCSTRPELIEAQACAGCHQAETVCRRNRSDKHAMQHAMTASVLGNFDDATFGAAQCPLETSATHLGFRCMQGKGEPFSIDLDQ
ncbi:hypothetical protein [Bradyrhizobium sp. DASA03120]|uniref:hypothetical protein n=1 Tax=Bradyrhizobium sp. SMVTL-02 TaxID=3395917 RepID=UPI003F6E44A8